MVDSALSFATDMIHALPECVCLYLVKPDIIIPNTRWKEDVGEMYRLADLKRMGIDVEQLVSRVTAAGPAGESFDVPATGDSMAIRRLLFVPVPGHMGIYVMYLRDETEVRRVEQMRKDFIANVSHELRTPLTAVKGYIETLLDPQFLTMERVRQFLPVIFEHTERLHNLMLDLLSLSRLESPNTFIELSPLNLADQLNDSIQAVTPLARMKNVNVTLTDPAEDLLVLANTEHMERILVNLLDNAIKYSDPNGSISIWAEKKGDVVWTHVKDEGPGIAPEEVGRVFERFYRTRSALSGRARGSGLGLAIVKHIVQQLGGEIRVSSRPGEGSNFYFSLRVAHAEGTLPPNILGHQRPERQPVGQ